MINKEWLMSLNKQQRRRRKNKGEIPEFAIYRWEEVIAISVSAV